MTKQKTYCGRNHLQNEWEWALSTNKLLDDLKRRPGTVDLCLRSLYKRNVKSIIGRHAWQKGLTTLAEGSVKAQISQKITEHKRNVQQLLKLESQLLNSIPM